MSDTIEYPTSDEAQRFSEEFDRIVTETLNELETNKFRLRTDVIMADRDEGESSPVRLGATLYVSKAVNTDRTIRHYDNPNDDELREILARAANYTGTWYHSRVTLHHTGKWTRLQAKVADLEEDSGVYLVFHYPKVTSD